MAGETALDEGWARYSTDQLERLLERLLVERGIPLPSVIADLRNEIARRRNGDLTTWRRTTMARAHSQINLTDVDDAAPANGFGARWEARVARDDLDAEQTGLTYFRIHPGKRSPFAHRHRHAEEVYVVISGTGRVKLDDEIFAVRALDAIRVAPGTARAFEAGPEGLELIAFGPHHEADGEPVDDSWVK